MSMASIWNKKQDFLSGGKLNPREHSKDCPFNAPLGRSYLNGHHAQNLAIQGICPNISSYCHRLLEELNC
ncbi:hypothetical protein DPMN_072076 [Dreissena polymorpha]|uniref:Uncharacterized protein n=1 Tax=Dreissena polymorpha TaxID=45954 RepID=A0A9D3Z7X0_DREPO|nr:hypothetical protein DPMN_072076 [Dreissena polymorpha]